MNKSEMADEHYPKRIQIPSSRTLQNLGPEANTFWDTLKRVKKLKTNDTEEVLCEGLTELRKAFSNLMTVDVSNASTRDSYKIVYNETKKKLVENCSSSTCPESQCSDYRHPNTDDLQTRSETDDASDDHGERVMGSEPLPGRSYEQPPNPHVPSQVRMASLHSDDAVQRPWPCNLPDGRPAAYGYRAPMDMQQPQRESDVTSLANAITEAMQLNRMPIAKPSVFNGEILDYRPWRVTFDQLITQRNINPAEKLMFLKEYTGPAVHKLISCVEYIPSDETFSAAMQYLEDRFGDDIFIANAFRTKLDEYRELGYHEHARLQEYADLLKQIHLAYRCLHTLTILDDNRELVNMARKLPDASKRKWASKVLHIHENGRRPLFTEFVDFVSKEAQTVNNPVLKALFEREFTHTKKKSMKTYTSDTSTIHKELSCRYCDGGHRLQNCKGFERLSPQAKDDHIKANRLCYGCLTFGHRSNYCRKRNTCESCGKRHPTIICGLYEAVYAKSGRDENSNYKNSSSPIRNRTTNVKVAEVKVPRKDAVTARTTLRTVDQSQGHATDNPTYTMVVPVFVSTRSNPEDEVLTYALLDSQSDATFISDVLASQLTMANGKPVDLELTTMNSSSTVRCKEYEGLQVRGLDSQTIITLPTSYSRASIPGDYSQVGTADTARKYEHLKKIQHRLHKLQDCSFGLLIGCDCSTALAPINFINSEMPYAQETALGWSIVGKASLKSRTLKSVVRSNLVIGAPSEVTYSCMLSKKDQFTQITRILESDFIEQKNDDRVMSQDDIKFLKIIENSIHQKESGFYELKLPFRSENCIMPNNQGIILKRLHYLKQRLLKNDRYHNDYNKFMNGIIDRQEAEEVPVDEIQNSCWYIPHHGVYHKKKPEKIRIVFDCSSTFGGASLNRELLQGPDMLNNMTGILCRFRREQVAFIGDVEKMYHRFHVTPKDRDFLRFYWFKDGNLDSTPVMYRMKVLLFGAVCSPACANYALKKIAEDHQTPDTKKAAEYIQSNFYVDDGLYSSPTVHEAIKVIKDARSICAKGNLRLHKFVSNNNLVLGSIPQSEVAEKKSQDLCFDKDLDRVLGIHWSTATDTFRFQLSLPIKPETRRGILSTVSSVYDPLGLIAPFTLRGKLILQAMCQEAMDWDEPLHGDLLQRWKNWAAELHMLEDIKIPRCYKPPEFGSVKSYELHHFCDGSLQAYGQCTYMRLVDENDQIHCTLVMAKARVAPRKVLTIPRLELMAAVTSVKVSNVLRRELSYDDIKFKEYFWTDSIIVLSYIQSDAKRFHVFVSNRIQTILDSSHKEQWRHVPTQDNPADHSSRGLRAQDISPSNWLKGPSFLWSVLPEPIAVSSDIPADDPEVKKVVVHRSQINSFSLMKRLAHFSDWRSALNGIQLLRTFIMKKQNRCFNDLDQMKQTEIFVIKKCQAECLQKEIYSLQNKETIENKHLASLDPFLDGNNVLRVGGRLKQSTLIEYGVKHPVILPRDSHLTNLILKHYHESTQHQGRGMTISLVRSKGFYVIGISRLVSTLIYNCVRCRRLRHSLQHQKMADLPPDRLDPSPPFTSVSIDCFGPYTVKERRSELKRYGILFVCMASRAIHIELLDDMSTDCFLNALRCFMAIRGSVSTIRCDQGTNFVGASHELKKAYEHITCDKIKSALKKQQCEFIFNSPTASHMGGHFERHIRTIRSILNNILYTHGSRLDTSSLRTFMYEVMTLVNSRPLTNTYLHDSDLVPLTPNHLLMMKPQILAPPPGEFVTEDIYARKRWRRTQQLVNQFWNRWRNEYVLNLQRRQKWTKTSRDLEEGDIVIVKDEAVYRGDWKLGRVVKCIGSKDHVRRVQLILGDAKRTMLERPIHKLVLLLENEHC